MAAQPKPLRFLFSKYAALAPNRTSQPEPQQEVQPHGALRPLKLPGWSKAGSLSDLHLLGSDVSQSKLDRIHVFLALSEVPGRSPPSVVDSSVGTSSTQDTVASRGQSRGRPRVAGGGRGSACGSPTRFRSRSQEFENIYRLAASRCSPEFLRNGRFHLGNSAHPLTSSYPSVHSPPGISNNKPAQLNGKHNIQKHYAGFITLNSKRPDSANSNNLSTRGEDAASTRGITQVMIEERRNTNTDLYGSLRPAHLLNYSYQDLNSMIGGNYPYPSNSRLCQRPPPGRVAKRRDETETGVSTVEQEQRIPARQLLRCPSLSTVDADRLDSSCYHYLLEEFSSDSESSALISGASDGASSKVSARAQRPSTSGTEATTQRLRNLYTRTTDLSSPPSQTQSILPSGIPGISGAPVAPSSIAKSPELPWPPHYALNPPWTSYEDIQALNGMDLGYLSRRTRRSRDRERYRKSGGMWGKDYEIKGNPKGKVHVVPSHVDTECEQCNVYNTHCAKHKAPEQSACPSSPLSNSTQTAENNHNINKDNHKPSFSSQHSQTKEENNRVSPSKLYLPPPTATTNSSLKVNIGIKDKHSASTCRTRANVPSIHARHEKPMSGTRPPSKGTLLLGTPGKTSFLVDSSALGQSLTRHPTSADPRPGQEVLASSDSRTHQTHQRKPRSSVAYSWDRASKVSFVNTTV